jgi:hypothetical protein
VTVLEHFDKLREKLLANNGSRHFLYSFFSSQRRGLLESNDDFDWQLLIAFSSPKRGICQLTNE